MKTNYMKAFAAFLLMGFLVTGCKKSDDPAPSIDPPAGNEVPEAIKKLLEENVNAAVSGTVTDAQQKPVEGATVKLGSKTTTTDAKGTFSFIKGQVRKNNAFISIYKEGFFSTGKTIAASEDGNHATQISLIAKESPITFNGADGGTVNFGSGNSIQFKAGSIVNATTNAAYTGTVTVYAKTIDPSAAELQPGTRRGISKDYKHSGLSSFGMFAVEMVGAGGEKLQLAAGKPATVSYTIPAELQGKLPETVQLWRFNDSTGLWKEGGSITRKGNVLAGETDHFSFWSFDAGYSLTTISGIIKDQHGNPLTQARITIKETGNPATSAFGEGNTGFDGVVNGWVPIGINLQMTIYNHCGTVLLQNTVGPYTFAHVDLGTVTATNTGTTVTIAGTALSCNADTLQTGYANVSIDGINYRGDIVNGTFNVKVPRCANTPAQAKVVITDATHLKLKDTLLYNVTTDSLNTGPIFGCADSQLEYVRLNLNGQVYNFNDAVSPFTKNANMFFWSIRCSNSQASLWLSFLSLGGITWNYPNSSAGFQINLNGVLWPEMYYDHRRFTITELGPINTGYVAGYYSEMTENPSGQQVPFTVYFRVKRFPIDFSEEP